MKIILKILITSILVIISLLAILNLPERAIEFRPITYQSIDENRVLENKIFYKTEIKDKKGNPNARLEFEILKKQNPVTKQIPPNIIQRELAYAKKIDQRSTNMRTSNLDPTFTSRGPYNVGGRTRALKIDTRRDSTILAGGVSGGMWKSIDLGESWYKTTAVDQLANATAVEQDRRTGFEDTWFYGTGEISGNSAGKRGAPYRGDGIYKSDDNGDSWTVIPSTSSGGITDFDSPFKYVNSLLVNYLNTSEREMYAAVFGGIIRTVNDFETYEFVLGSEDYNGGRYTEIEMTSSGVFYASISDEGNDEQTGIFTSEDGINWTDITPYGDNDRFERVVIGVAPSYEDSVYFHSSGDEYRIHLYDNESGSWTDLSNNIPSFGDPVGDPSQGAYNMFLAVHPSSSKVVYLGSINVYRSTDGFTSTDNISWIGGYSYVNNVSIYENHHPDQHYLEFLSSNPNYMLTSNDGGVQLTLDNLKDTVEWVSLNNGYITSQFYSAAVNLQDPGDNRLLGGLQDNSSWYGFNTDPNAEWQDIWSGDGCFSAITYNSLYVSTQNMGSMYRYGFDEEGEQNGQGRLFPPNAGYLFVNPWVEDPVDPNRIYLAAEGVVYYTLDATQFPAGNDWITLAPATTLPVENVSALGISTEPAHAVYVGTENGNLFVMPNSSDNTLAMVDVTGENFPEDGYINSIEVDEYDADRAIVVFTNYEVISVFITEDGGTSWTPISGNLEENSDGSGAGIGINWIESVRVSEGNYFYFLGTNAGLYGTELIDGMNTTWTKLAQGTIGNSVVDMIRVRSSDGYIVVGTHGDGMFEANIDKGFELRLTKSGSLNFCDGDSVTFRAARSENFNYQWYKDGVAIDGATNFSYSAKEGGEFYAGVTLVDQGSNGDEDFISNSFATIFNGKPDATISVDGDMLSVRECANCTYFWLDGSGNTIAEGPTFDITTTNESGVRVLISNDCFSAQSDVYELIVTGVESLVNASVYPNPTSDFLNISFVDITKVNVIEIFDINGAKVDSFIPVHSKINYDISGLSNGLFFVKIYSNTRTESFKLLKE